MGLATPIPAKYVRTIFPVSVKYKVSHFSHKEASLVSKFQLFKEESHLRAQHRNTHMTQTHTHNHYCNPPCACTWWVNNLYSFRRVVVSAVSHTHTYVRTYVLFVKSVLQICVYANMTWRWSWRRGSIAIGDNTYYEVENPLLVSHKDTISLCCC